MSLTLGCWFRLQLQKLKFPHYEGELDLVHLALVKENVFTVHVDCRGGGSVGAKVPWPALKESSIWAKKEIGNSNFTILPYSCLSL